MVRVDADKDRLTSDGRGLEIAYGRDWTEHWSWEGVVSWTVLETGWGAGTDFYENSFGADFTRRFGRVNRFNPFVVVGAGIAKNDVLPDEEDDTGAYLHTGVGFETRPLGAIGVRIRAAASLWHDEFQSGVEDMRYLIGATVPLGVRSRERVVERVVERIVYRDAPAVAPQVVYVEAPDADGDGIVDAADRCPNTLTGAEVDATGCITSAQNVQLAGVNFETGSARLVQSAERILDKVLLTLRDQPAIRIEIAGHTDSQGAEPANLTLSEQRAETVRAYLVGRGVDPARVTARGYGEGEPLVSEITAEDRAQNRRVEFRIRDPQQ